MILLAITKSCGLTTSGCGFWVVVVKVEGGGRGGGRGRGGVAPYSQDVYLSSTSSADCDPKCSLPISTSPAPHLLSACSCTNTGKSGLTYCACGCCGDSRGQRGDCYRAIQCEACWEFKCNCDFAVVFNSDGLIFLMSQIPTLIADGSCYTVPSSFTVSLNCRSTQTDFAFFVFASSQVFALML